MRLSRRSAIRAGAALTASGWLLRASAGEKSSARVIVVSTDFSSIQAAIDSLPSEGGEVLIPPGTHTVDRSINLTRKSGYGGGVTLTGAGASSVIVGRTSGEAVLDFTGSSHATIRDLVIDAENLKPSEQPSVGLLLARRPDAVSSQEHRFDNLICRGHFNRRQFLPVGQLGKGRGCRGRGGGPARLQGCWQ